MPANESGCGKKTTASNYRVLSNLLTTYAVKIGLLVLDAADACGAIIKRAQPILIVRLILASQLLSNALVCSWTG